MWGVWRPRAPLQCSAGLCCGPRRGGGTAVFPPPSSLADFGTRARGTTGCSMSGKRFARLRSFQRGRGGEERTTPSCSGAMSPAPYSRHTTKHPASRRALHTHTSSLLPLPPPQSGKAALSAGSLPQKPSHALLEGYCGHCPHKNAAFTCCVPGLLHVPTAKKPVFSVSLPATMGSCLPAEKPNIRKLFYSIQVDGDRSLQVPPELLGNCPTNN